MSTPAPAHSRDRLYELMAAHAVDDISPDERRELAALAQSFPDVSVDEMDLAAGALAVCFAQADHEPLPVELVRSLADRAGAWSGEKSSAPQHAATPGGRNGALTHPATDRSSTAARGTMPPGRSQTVFARLGWLAAAAGFALAAIAWFGGNTSTTQTSGTSSEVSPAVALANLVKEVPTVVRKPWTKGTDSTASAASGELVWCKERQEGYMVFKGLAKNDPAREQYQLWIFDKNRDERYPVDGGVFDVRGDDVVVKIKPHLSVPQATLFVLTVERPGGVWVSDRSRIAVLADISGG